MFTLFRCSPSWYEYPTVQGRDLIVFAGHSFSLINYMYWEKIAMGTRLTIIKIASLLPNLSLLAYI